MSSVFAIYGASGFGREVMPLARKMVAALSSNARLVFIDDGLAGQSCNGYEVISYCDFRELDADELVVSIAIADSVLRERLWRQCEADGLISWDVRADNAVIMDAVELGPGYILCPFVTLTSNITIGDQFHANIYSYVAHDCKIGNFVTFAPSVKCNGNVVIEDYAYVGTGAVLKQGQPGSPLVIGEGAVVGMGAVVTKNVPPGATVVGNPARPLMKS